MNIKKMIRAYESYLAEFKDDNNPNALYTSRAEEITGHCYQTYSRIGYKKTYLLECKADLKFEKDADDGSEIRDSKQQKILNQMQSTKTALLDLKDTKAVCDHFYHQLTGEQYILPKSASKHSKVTYTNQQQKEMLADLDDILNI